MDESTYHAGMRELQDRFDTRRLADRLDERLGRSALTAEDRTFIESRSMFFLASADAEGRPDCSYKGGDPGFVRITADNELALPSYDGNGMFRSLGNVLVNAAVGLLFIDFERPKRLRVNGRATVADDDPIMADFVGRSLWNPGRKPFPPNRRPMVPRRTGRERSESARRRNPRRCASLATRWRRRDCCA
jgi:hypothetical protein